MTTEKNFFVRQDVTGFFMMLQGAPGAGWGFGRGVGIWGPVRGGNFFSKMGNFLPFCRFFAVWVEICICSRLCMISLFSKTYRPL